MTAFTLRAEACLYTTPDHSRRQTSQMCRASESLGPQKSNSMNTYNQNYQSKYLASISFMYATQLLYVHYMSYTNVYDIHVIDSLSSRDNSMNSSYVRMVYVLYQLLRARSSWISEFLNTPPRLQVKFCFYNWYTCIYFVITKFRKFSSSQIFFTSSIKLINNR